MWFHQPCFIGTRCIRSSLAPPPHAPLCAAPLHRPPRSKGDRFLFCRAARPAPLSAALGVVWPRPHWAPVPRPPVPISRAPGAPSSPPPVSPPLAPPPFLRASLSPLAAWPSLETNLPPGASSPSSAWALVVIGRQFPPLRRSRPHLRPRRPIARRSPFQWTGRFPSLPRARAIAPRSWRRTSFRRSLALAPPSG